MPEKIAHRSRRGRPSQSDIMRLRRKTTSAFHRISALRITETSSLYRLYMNRRVAHDVAMRSLNQVKVISAR
jgi:hypothetical protein